MHFTRHVRRHRPRDPGHRPGRGRLGLRPARQALPRRPVRPVHQPARPRSDGAGRGGRPSRPPSWPTSRCGATPTRRPSSWPSSSPTSPRATQPHLLHHRRLRGGGVGLEAGPPVLQADRPARALPRSSAGTSPTTAPPWGPCRSPASPRSRRRSSRWCPGPFKVPNTNFYRAPYFADDDRGLRPLGRRRHRAGHPDRGPRDGGRRLPRAGAERRRLLPPAPRLLPAGARDLRPLRRAARLRRGHLRLGPARPLLRRRALRLRAGHDHHGQGPDQRLLAARGPGRQRPADRAVPRRVRSFLHGITFAGHPVSAAVALANIDVFEKEGILEQRPRARGRVPGLPRHPAATCPSWATSGAPATSTASRWSRTRTPRRPSTTTRPSACCAASCPAPSTSPGSSAGPTTGATR